jgi:Ca2+-binding RTX toxin-like protein
MARLARFIPAFALVAGLAFVVPSASAHTACSVRSGSGSDVLTGSMTRDRICARGGDDSVFALDGNDVVRAGAGNDTVQGGQGDDAVWGAGGSDSLVGGQGKDVLRGGSGDDVLDVTDGVGGDRAFGGRGTDRCIVDANDVVHGCESVSVAR